MNEPAQRSTAVVRKFVVGLSRGDSTRSLLRQPDDEVVVTDGPYTKTREQK